MNNKKQQAAGGTIPPSRRQWWKEAVVYQIYPRSFQDSNADGIGDLKGIISRLDYVRNLGVDAIWLNPIFASPNDDNGYDISDYRRIMKEFGTMHDFEELLRQAHLRGLRVILDLVVNHTSDEHPWFVAARQSRENPYYDYYLWWPAEDGQPPMRPSYFDEDGTAWKYNEATDSYYLHYFGRKQPDLNWDNPKVRAEIYDMMRFWLEKGIDGFRMDSISLISKDTRFPEIDAEQYPGLFEYYARGPHLHRYLHEMNREVLHPYQAMSVGEGSAVGMKDAIRFVSPERQELDMLYHFDAAWVRNNTGPDSPDSGLDYSLITLKKMFADWDKAVGDGWPSVYLGNHDQPRMVSRFGSERPSLRRVSAEMLATFLLTMRGTPYWYMGDEIGMTNIRFKSIGEYRDIETINQYKRLKEEGGDTKAFLAQQEAIARDNARTPFQWDESENAGFTTGEPWLPVNPNYHSVNVADEVDRSDSALSFFRRAVSFRRSHPQLVYGDFELLDAANPKVFAYLRKSEGMSFLVVLNFSPLPAETLPGPELRRAEIVFSNYPGRRHASPSRKIRLKPFEAVVFRLG